MGNRISISFKRGDTESVAIFSHWDGMELRERAVNFVRQLRGELNLSGQWEYPLERLEPRTVVFEFVRSCFEREARKAVRIHDVPRIFDNYYLGRNEKDGDNGDNGHHVVDINAILKEEQQ